LFNWITFNLDNTGVGPATYMVPTALTPTGTYVNSKYRSAGTIRFLKSIRGQMSKSSSLSNFP
jgi:hypothetical protein